ncbi:extracellular calcium-sensing receptor-like [Ambystoma mexicanum]|uniref:extracellular calcium-sensing receptor-like n=1 Tax=Ambystoma mexicanum TaxID=8296 RepID=UPI0037E7E597
MMFAVEEINVNPNLLPNITLGFQIYDSCRIMQRSLEGTLWILAGQKVPVPNFRCQRNLPLMGIIGDAGSSCSVVMARLLGIYRFPQISYVSTSPLLSNRNQFPSFLRTIPSDNVQSPGLAQLLIHFGWTWVGLLIEDNDYGQLGATLLKQEFEKAGGCIAFSENIILSRADRNALHIIRVIQNSTANVIVVFCSDAGLNPLMEEMIKHNVTGRVWIATDGWSISTILAVERYSKILTGTIGFTTHSEKMPGFVHFLKSAHPSKYRDDIFLQRFWEEAAGCRWVDPKTQVQSLQENTSKVCSGDENLESLYSSDNDETRFRGPYNVYVAVYASAWALHNLKACKTRGEPLLIGTCAEKLAFKPWQLLHYVKNVRFKNKAGVELFFSPNGEVPPQYDIVNWQRSPDGALMIARVGSYDSSAPQGQKFTISSSDIGWPSASHLIPVSVCSQSCLPGYRKAAKDGEPICCFICIPCPQGEISNQTDYTECIQCQWDHWPNDHKNKCVLKTIEFLAYDEPLGSCLTATCVFCSLIPIAITELFILHRNTPIVKANNRTLSYLLLISLTLCFLCSLAFIGYPTPEKCLLRQAAFGVIFALCVSCILAKTIIVIIAFNATKPNSNLNRWVGPKCSYVVITVCTFIQILLCVSWLLHSPPFSENNINTHPGTIIVECNEGSPVAFWCMLGYLGLLATNSFIVAFLARKLPDSFNEAQFITFSMLAFLSVWLSFIPAYLSTKGKYMVAMEIFAILTSSSALVVCIFLPKCYIILLRPQMNTKEYLMGKKTGHVKKDSSTHMFPE